MNIAILGYDTEGRSSYEYFVEQGGHELTILDINPDLVVPEGAQTVLGDQYLNDLYRFDMIVRTAGLQPSKIFDANPGLVKDKVTTQINLFMQDTPTKHIVGITGTKGKGTTSTLAHKMLQATGHKSFLAGNIGVPALSLVPQLKPDDWVVLELSSFQLSDIRYSPPIAVCLMVVPEHLNWHPDFEDYNAAKSHLFDFQTSDDVAIFNGDDANSQAIAAHGAGRKLPYFREPGAYVNSDREIIMDGKTICSTTEIKLLGAHNWQNVCAAITAVWQVTQDIAAIRSVITSFTGLEHRLNLVRELDGVRYYDDSFGTTPETAIVALRAFDEPKLIILGGSDKGASYDELAQAVLSNDVRQVLLIGQEAKRIEKALDAVGFTDYVPSGDTMEQIVEQAQDLAQPGDVVLLSPACASFDMFTDYKDRAARFIACVNGLSSNS